MARALVLLFALQFAPVSWILLVFPSSNLLPKTFSRFPYSSPFHLDDRNRQEPKSREISFPLHFRLRSPPLFSRVQPLTPVGVWSLSAQIRPSCRCPRGKRTDSQKVRYHPARWPRGRGRTSRSRRCVYQQTDTRERQRQLLYRTSLCGVVQKLPNDVQVAHFRNCRQSHDHGYR